MNRYKKVNLIYGFIILGLLAWVIFRRFANPGLTETQLFLSYWYEWLILLILWIIGLFWYIHFPIERK
jgi:hypothetical protein